VIKKMSSAKLHCKKDMRRVVSSGSHFVGDPEVLARKLHSAVSRRGLTGKNQGSDEGAPRIPDLRKFSENNSKKALPPSLFAEPCRNYSVASGMPVSTDLHRIPDSFLTHAA
jgi:hypothetical protein